MLDYIVPASKVGQVTEFGYYVMGKKATKNEYNVALALEHEGVEFQFQWYYMGGRDVLGGYVLDFVVYSPFRTPVEVFGNYWHTGQMESGDRLKLAIIAQEFGRQAIVIWGNESDTYDLALQAVQEESDLTGG